jgi:Transposase DDE domain group 1
MAISNWAVSTDTMAPHMYFPVLINETLTGYPLVLQLRAGNSHSGKGVAGILRWLFWQLQRAWPGVRLILRADAGFSLPEVIQVCERSDVGYVFGFSRNAVLNRKIADLLERARLKYMQTQQKARLFDDVYYAANPASYNLSNTRPSRSSFKCSGLIPSPKRCSVAFPTKNFSNKYNGALTNPSPFKIIALTI